MARQETVERKGIAERGVLSWTPWRPGSNPGSARSLLLTLLGEFVLRDGGRAWTSTLLDAMVALGVEPKTARQAIARTATAGLLTSERWGRQVRWALTDRAWRLLTEGAARIYEFGRRAQEWDGRWLLLLVTVPETDRHLRYRLRVSLQWQGFAALGPGVWACPWVEREAAAVAVLEELGLARESLSLAGAPGALGAFGTRAQAAWDLAAVAVEYQSFIEATLLKRPASPADCFVDLTTLVHDWRHFPAADPALPAQLLPRTWPAQAAAELFHQRHGTWEEPAWQWWHSRAGTRPGPASPP